ARLQLKHNPAAEGEEKRRGPRYTPLSKRQDRPSAIAWLVKYHPELSDGQISKLVGTTKPTIQSIRDRSHWNIANIQPVDPVALGMCKQGELDAAVAKASAKKAKSEPLSEEEKLKLMSTDESLQAQPEPRIPAAMAGLENFSFGDQSADPRGEEEESDPIVDADSLFNLPKSPKKDDDPQP
ncbi:MAG: cell cycle transcriptional regulator TrcR, partial [Pseudomonadota bacterium]